MKKVLLTLALLTPPAWAGPGHDHAHDHETSSAVPAPTQPRFNAQSELFELVGVLDGRQLTLYLDRASSNEPVTQAELELEIAGSKHQAKAHADGSFRVELASALRPGLIPITTTVITTDDSDLLVAELDLQGDEQAHEAGSVPWKTWGGLAAALAVGGVLGRFAWPRRGQRRAS